MIIPSFLLLCLSTTLAQTYIDDEKELPNPAITQIVVLMLENRSFDTMLGRLKTDGLNPLVNGPVLNKIVNRIRSGPDISTRTVDSAMNIAVFNPGHEVSDVTEQLYGYNMYAGQTNGSAATMGGFAENTMRKLAGLKDVPLPRSFDEVFGLHGPDTLPVSYALAQEFTVVDDWFSSVPGPTYPNRHFLHCATSKGKTTNQLNYLTGLKCKTTFTNLEEEGKTWKVYADGPRPLASVMLYNDFRSVSYLRRVQSFGNFREDAKSGSLPQYSYIDPNFQENDNHPPHNLQNGESFLKRVYETLRASPQWSSTLLVVTYDEHGGHYDHVSPPVGIPIPDNSTVIPQSGDFKFERLGVRVPTILISPWVPKGGVFRSGVKGRYIEHSSVSATLKNMFGLKNFLTKRDAWAISLHTVTNTLSKMRDDCMKIISL